MSVSVVSSGDGVSGNEAPSSTQLGIVPGLADVAGVAGTVPASEEVIEILSGPASSQVRSASGSEYGDATDGGQHRRRRSNFIHEQFEANRQEAAQEAILEVRTVYIGTLLLGLLIIVVATYFEVRSVYVLFATYHLPCDQPLWRWLLGHIGFGMIRECFSSGYERALLAMHVLWTFYGYYWFTLAKTCTTGNPMLYDWVEIVLFVAAVFLVASTVLPLLMYASIMVLVVLLNSGLLNNVKAARTGTLERLEVVAYDPTVFAPENSPDDPRPLGDCCCCAEAFDSEHVMVKTPCQHYYHKACLGDWLKLAKTCPLCRSDLEELLWNLAPPSPPSQAEVANAAVPLLGEDESIMGQI